MHVERSYLSVGQFVWMFQPENCWPHFMKFDVNIVPTEETQSLYIYISYSQ
jgi:hypothetical protein